MSREPIRMLLLALAVTPLVCAGDTYVFSQLSSPAGFISFSSTNAAGSSVATTNAPLAVSGYRFAYWTLDMGGGPVKQVDMLGRAVNSVQFTLVAPTVATACYLPEAQDTNTNGVPDWYELQFYPSLTNTACDTDGDGFNLWEEYRRDGHPGEADQIVEGGLSVSFSAIGTVIVNTNLAMYSVSSVPAGFASGGGVTNIGTSITVSNAFGLTNGYRFAYWTVNGVVATDATGRALSGFTFSLATNSTVVAVFLLAGQDANTNGIPDWYELNMGQGLGSAPDGDADGDGFSLLEEYRRDYHAGMADILPDGGVSISYSASSLVIPNTNFAAFSQSSLPAGLVPTVNLVTNNGTWLSVSNAFGIQSGYRFAYWTVNGAIQTDLTGRAMAGFPFALQGSSALQAVFTLQNADLDTNGIPDWFERNFFGATGQTPSADPDGDGFTLLEEYRRDYDPLLADTIQDGGVSIAFSAVTLMTLDTNCAAFNLYTTPAGLASASAITNLGATLTAPAIFGFTNGYRFAYWLLNGCVQTDFAGRALSGFAFSLSGNTTVQGVFQLAGQDSDGDGVPDWFAQNFYGPAGRPAASDTDGDGFTLLEEYRRDYDPLLADQIVDGGIAISYGLSTAVDLRYFPRVGECLAGGVMSGFFSLIPPGTGTFAMAGCSAPALGDWDGDGDLDLFVGGTGGQLRVYENGGSPQVPNFIDRTASFAAVAPLWAGINAPAPALGDWNGDGIADLAVGGDTGVVFLIASTTNFLSPQSPAFPNALNIGTASALPAFGDINGDGRLDLLILLPDGSVNAYTNTASADTPFVAGGVISNLLGLSVANATGITTADVNDDGNFDILIADNGGNIWEFDGDGAGHFSVKSKVFAGSFAGFADRLTLAAGDLDGDGNPDVLGGYAQGGLVYLRNPAPKLVIAPPSVTLLPGGDTIFRVPGHTNIAWSLLRTASAGTLDATSGVYQAGALGGCIDVIEGLDATGLKGRAYVNVITAADMARAGRAVVIAGRRSPDDPLWPTTDYLSQLGYNTLLYRGFAKANVRYLSPVPGRDMDGNGQLDDIAGETTYANVAQVFTNWMQSPGDVFIYLVDHGGDSSGAGYFRLNASEVLTASNLDLWLDRIQDRYSNAVTVVIDCCYAGSFLDELAYHGTARRTVIAACGTNEPTYFVSGGLVSFSDAFFSGVMLGLDLADCFSFAKTSIQVYQGAMVDDNGDGRYVEGVDGNASRDIAVGVTLVAGRDIPQIGSVCANQALNGDSAATLWAGDVVSGNPIQRVWCLVAPPGYSPDPANPVDDVPEIELPFSASSGRYQGAYGGFGQKGTYQVQFYAQDIWGSIAVPRQAYVTQNGFDERVVLVGGGSTHDARWPAINTLCSLAWQTFRNRWFSRQSICCLNAGAGQDFDSDGTNDVSALPSLAGLADAITNWAAASDKLTVYLIGDGSNSTFRLSETETLTPQLLGAWLDAYQTSNREVSVIMDFPGAGVFLPSIRPPPGRTRITVASAKSGQNNSLGNGGLASFSQYFLSDLFNGYTIGKAFSRAKAAIYGATGKVRQEPQLDDTGDGVCNGKDGAVAAQHYIGSAFITGADVPVVGSAMPDGLLASDGPPVLWAADVTAMDGVSNVWCLITPPDYDGAGDLQQASLAWNPVVLRYECVGSNLTQAGSYVCTFLAVDGAGKMSSPVQSAVVTAIRATGVVRDRNTGAWLDNAALEFQATSGSASGMVYTAYPVTNDANRWVTRTDGTFPDDVWLPAETDWDLAVRQAGYSNGLASGLIRNAAPGAVTNLGTLWLAPLDTNGNGVADAWEQLYFPGRTLVLTNDDDGDGMNNLQEYLCGTDPTNKASALRLQVADGYTTNGFTLSWPVSSGRRYRVMATDALPAGLWPLTNGPWDATDGQTLMRWTDTNGVARTNRFYRVESAGP